MECSLACSPCSRLAAGCGRVAVNSFRVDPVCSISPPPAPESNRKSNSRTSSGFGFSSLSGPTLSAGKYILDLVKPPSFWDSKDDQNGGFDSACSVNSGGLVDGGLVYREKFAIRCYEVGINRTATIDTIANLLQEIACNHAKSVGFSEDGFATTPAMRANGLIWVTTRLHIEMDEYPQWGDVVEIDTWFQWEGRILSRRDWVIKLAGSGKTMGKMTSSWAMMSESTRRLSRIPEEVVQEVERHCPSPPRYAVAPASSTKLPKFALPGEFAKKNLMPRRSDLDMNKHVNNVTYVSWMLESLPEDVLNSAELVKLTLEYRRECSQGDMVDSLAKQVQLSAGSSDISLESGNGEAHLSNGAAKKRHREIEFLHLLCRHEEDERGPQEINKGRTVWRLKEGGL